MLVNFLVYNHNLGRTHDEKSALLRTRDQQKVPSWCPNPRQVITFRLYGAPAQVTRLFAGEDDGASSEERELSTIMQWDGFPTFQKILWRTLILTELRL
jgi:hypothetical protein